MGSFASTCAISGLPIEAGDAVRWFLLTQNPYCDGGFVCDSYGRWVPRTWPVRAEYNDYGSIENWEEGPLLDVIMQGFQSDLIEVGVGDNSIHDVSARKDMSFEQLLEAVWEGRVSVERDVGYEKKEEVPDWVPTLRNVEECLSAIATGKGRYLVDEPEDADYVRVRWDGLSAEFGKDAHWLGLAQATLSQFQVKTSPGTGSYKSDLELHVGTREGKEYKKRKIKTLLIQQAMIREDVWQALLKLKVPIEWGAATADVEFFRNGAKKGIAEMQETKDALALLRCGYGRTESVGAMLLGREVLPYHNGLHSHFLLLLKNLPEGFSDLAGEFAFLWRLLQGVRYVWRPSDTAGSQFGEFDRHVAFLRAIADVAAARDSEKERWDDEGDEE